jgi:hypothetical protein
LFASLWRRLGSALCEICKVGRVTRDESCEESQKSVEDFVFTSSGAGFNENVPCSTEKVGSFGSTSEFWIAEFGCYF